MEILKVLRCLCNERGWPTKRWPDVLAETEYILNSTEVASLGNRSPIECHTGIRPKSTTEFVAVHGPTLRTADVTVTKLSRVDEYAAQLGKKIEEIQDRVKRERVAKRKLNWKAQRPATEPVIRNPHWGFRAKSRDQKEE